MLLAIGARNSFLAWKLGVHWPSNFTGCTLRRRPRSTAVSAAEILAGGEGEGHPLVFAVAYEDEHLLSPHVVLHRAADQHL